MNMLCMVTSSLILSCIGYSSVFFLFGGALEVESKNHPAVDTVLGICRIYGNPKCPHNVDKNIKCISSY